MKLQQKNIIIVGATGSMGQAIVKSLVQQDAQLYLVGRNRDELLALQESYPHHVTAIYVADVAKSESLDTLYKQLQLIEHVDVFIYAAGVIRMGRVLDATLSDFDLQYAVNLKAPFLLTRAVLPKLITAKGHILFINSSMGIMTKPLVSLYAATKHGLKAFADCLRAEVNAEGVKVTSIFPGSTAGDMQEQLHRDTGKAYNPDMFSQPEDIAHAVISCLLLPNTSEMTDIVLRPFRKESVSYEK